MKIFDALLFYTLARTAQCGLIGDTFELYTSDDWLQLVDCDSVYGSLLIQDWYVFAGNSMEIWSISNQENYDLSMTCRISLATSV